MAQYYGSRLNLDVFHRFGSRFGGFTHGRLPLSIPKGPAQPVAPAARAMGWYGNPLRATANNLGTGPNIISSGIPPSVAYNQYGQELINGMVVDRPV